MAIRPVAVFAATAMLLAAACARAPHGETKTPKPQTIDELRAAIAKVIEKYHVPGCGFALVARDRVIYAGGVGKADLSTNRDVNADTMFRVGSITKGFVALSLLKLQEEGKVDLNAKVSDLAPEVKIENPWERTDPVRIVNLLEHTSGFDDFSLAEFYDMSGGPESPLVRIFERFPNPQRVRWRPGTLAAYSNPGYGLAGYIVEKVSGRSIADYVAENILRPLAMAHSDLRLTAEVKAVLAQGYDGDPPWPVPYYPIYLRPAGQLMSSPNEMARFVRMMLNRGSLDGVKIVGPDSIARMETPATGLAAKAGLKYGYALGNLAYLDRSFVAHGHGGQVDGFLSDYQYLPDQGVGYFFSINGSYHAFDEIGDLLFDYVTRGLTPPPKPSAVPLDPQITQWTGFYEPASPRQEKLKGIEMLLQGGWSYVENGKLYRRRALPAARDELIFLGANQARTAKEAAASVVFCADQDGTRYSCGALACSRRTSPVWPLTRLALMVGAMLTMASSIGFAFIWIPRKVSGRMKGVGHLSVRIAPLVAVIVFAVSATLVTPATPAIVLATLNWRTVSSCVGIVLFAILSIVSLVLAIRSWSYAINRAARIHSMLVSVACCGVTLYYGYWGLIGFRTWAW